MRHQKRSRTQNTFLNLISGLGGEVIIYVLTFVTRTVFISTLGKEYLGIGGLFSNIMVLLSLTDMGVGVALNYRLYKPLKENNQHRIRIIMKFYKRMYFFIGCALLVLGCSFIPFLRYLIKDYETFDTLGISAAVVFLLYLMQSVSTYWFFAYKSAIVKADQKEYYINVVGYGTTFATNILQIVVLLLYHDFFLYICVVIFMNIATSYINALIANRLYPYLKEPCEDNISKEEKREIWKDCKSILMFSLNTVVLKATDNLVLAAFIGLSVVGMYANYLMVYNALKKVIKKFIRAAQASIGNLFVSVDGVERLTFFKVTNFFMFFFCGMISVMIAVLSDEFIGVWLDPSFIIPQPFSILIALELYTIGIKLILEQMRDVVGFFQKIKWRPIVGMVMNIVLSLILVQYYGIYGVLIATLISEWATTMVIDPFVVYKYSFENVGTVKGFYLTNALYLLELIAAGIICWIINDSIYVGHGWLSLIVHILIDLSIVLLVLIMCNCQNKVFVLSITKAKGMVLKRNKR